MKNIDKRFKELYLLEAFEFFLYRTFETEMWERGEHNSRISREDSDSVEASKIQTYITVSMWRVSLKTKFRAMIGEA